MTSDTLLRSASKSDKEGTCYNLRITQTVAIEERMSGGEGHVAHL